MRDGAAFISKDLWCGVLKESDGVEESVLSIPSNNNPTSLLGAGLFIKQFKRTDVFLDKMEINRRLEKYLPASYIFLGKSCIIIASLFTSINSGVGTLPHFVRV